jgi:hypothetical protein
LALVALRISQAIDSAQTFVMQAANRNNLFQRAQQEYSLSKGQVRRPIRACIVWVALQSLWGEILCHAAFLPSDGPNSSSDVLHVAHPSSGA